MGYRSLLAASLLSVLVGASAGATEPAPCTACHGDVAAHSHAAAEVSCASCHGDGSAHLAAPSAAGSIMGFADEPPRARAEACVGCHRDVQSGHTGAHQRAGLACNDCHQVHGQPGTTLRPARFEAIDERSAVCFGCHEETFTQFALNEAHRLAEGAIGCTDCHDPHAAGGGLRLGGFKQAQCAECHAHTDGPFLFEHAASRTEGCTACHAPHGSPNRHLLTHQQVGALCYTCHAGVPQFHLGFAPTAPARFDESTVCTNCHVTIHGSNLDRNFLR